MDVGLNLEVTVTCYVHFLFIYEQKHSMTLRTPTMSFWITFICVYSFICPVSVTHCTKKCHTIFDRNVRLILVKRYTIRRKKYSLWSISLNRKLNLHYRVVLDLVILEPLKCHSLELIKSSIHDGELCFTDPIEGKGQKGPGSRTVAVILLFWVYYV